jgi:hypothetical protein
VREIERCNQRGGRFLSIVDLLEAGTLDLELAAYLGAAVLQGNSFLVGAVPGGAGKTTVMGALLGFVPPDTDLCAATEGVPGAALREGGPRRCLICHEIGRGPYFAYLWGRDVRDFFRLPSAGHMGATNLHADDVAGARDIIVGGCGVAEDDFAAWPLLVFLRLRGRFDPERRIGAVWEGPEKLVFSFNGRAWTRETPPALGTPETRARVAELLGGLRGRRIEDVRGAVLDAFGAPPARGEMPSDA